MTERLEKTMARPESVEETQPGPSLSRRKLLAVTGSSAAAASLLVACGGGSSSDDSSDAGGSAADETSQFGDGDSGILNYLLTIEHLQVDFYAELTKSRRLTAAARKAVGEKFGEEEEKHVSRLTEVAEKLGGKPASKPQTKFSLNTDVGTLEVASTLENVGAAAYLGQLPKIESDSVLAAVLSIHSVEGRHAAAIDDLLGKEVTPDGAFAKPASVKSVLESIKPFLVELPTKIA